MAINITIQVYGFNIGLTNMEGKPEVLLDLGEPEVAQAIEEHDPLFLAALEEIKNNLHEIGLILWAEESRFGWTEGALSVDVKQSLHIVLRSRYASHSLKELVREVLGYIKRPARNADPLEWYAMMYGAYQAMSEEEREKLHEWERQYLDGSGQFSTSDWPGWSRYIGKFPASEQQSRRKRSTEGYVYLVRADTGEHKIGFSVDVGNRLKVFAVQPPFEYSLIHFFPAEDMVRAEASLHAKYATKRIKGEWFALDEEDVENIKRIVSYEKNHFIEQDDHDSL